MKPNDFRLIPNITTASFVGLIPNCLMVKLSIPNKFSSKNFIKKINFKENKVVINLSVRNLPLTMDGFPNSRKVLRKYLPSIFKCQCFNPENKSFFRECKQTEIGHLFEHIILEYMCMEKIQYEEEISYAGRTSWNADNMTGDFKIVIECGINDAIIFTKALKKAIKIMDIILEENKAPDFKTQRKQTIESSAPFGISY